MGWEAKPRYRVGRDAWFVRLEGKEYYLGKEEGSAWDKFRKIKQGLGGGLTQQDRRVTVGELVDRYLEEYKERVKRSTYRVTSYILLQLRDSLSRKTPAQMHPRLLEQWAATHPNWNTSTKNHAIACIHSLIEWAVAEGYLEANTARALKRPPMRSRGADSLITPDEYAKLLEGANASLRDVLVTLWETGARPGEVTAVRAADFRPEQSLWLLPDHKTARKTGEARIVHLTPPVVAICARLAERYSDGPLYRTEAGTPYKHCGLSKRVQWLRERMKLPARITPYSFRHTFATDALARGVPDALVAQLLGHKGTAMLHKHYAHLIGRNRELKDALGQFR